MVQGPQREGNPNIVVTEHGQQLARQSDTQYTHAVVHTTSVDEKRAQLQRKVDIHDELLGKYGEVESFVKKDAAKATKAMSALPESGPWAELVSMHTNEKEAEKRRTREANKRGSMRVYPVTQRPPEG